MKLLPLIIMASALWGMGVGPSEPMEMEEETYSALKNSEERARELSADAWEQIDKKLSGSESACVRCHYGEKKYEKLTILWAQSEHGKAKVGCEKCHGGNPDSSSLGKAKSAASKFRNPDPGFRNKKGPLAGFDDLAFDHCGQCHGDIYRDWKTGIHGKRTGSWSGEKTYRLCTFCHDPHSPRFPKLVPMPSPIRPDEISLESYRLMKSMME